MEIDVRLERARQARRTLGERRERFFDWQRRLTEELTELPDTLQRLRQGATNFELVSRRLEKSSDGLEQATKLYEATLADSTRRSADVAKTLRAQVDSLAAAGSPDRVLSTLRDVQRTVETLSEMNPLWPKSRDDSE